ncbi:MAG: SUMF1/EgtB/PvdO family nonheme iron enzyme [Gammaproteobacteria bacterium]|nr:SUMF1/EgtB/PvdO family nonheme iron enzyme [Gammaproteobacteria bacterium]
MTTLFISHSSKDKAWAQRVHQALSDAGYQCLFLDSHPDDGIHAGADWERMLYQRLRQSRGVIVLCTANWLSSPWCVAEAIMARGRKRRVFLVAADDIVDRRQAKGDQEGAPTIPEFLTDRQFVSLAGLTEKEAVQRLLQGLEREGLKKQDFKLPERPYPGLAPFQETDAAVFFGRDDDTDHVIDRLHRRRKGDAKGFVLLLGASGCGKSSLVRAGVIPQLRRAGKDEAAGPRWIVAPPVLAGRGIEGLALAFADAFRRAEKPRALQDVRGRMTSSGDLRLLAGELLDAHHAANGSVLLVLDQLEEVLDTPEESHVRAALALLLEASADFGSPLVVLATMRSDFLNAFQLFEGAADRYEAVTLDPMRRDHFGQVIEGPAERFGLDLDPGLATRMVQDTAYSDALPLLAFTVRKLYGQCKRQGRLTLAAYQALGGVSGAIEHAADSILYETGYKDLTQSDPRMRDLRRAFYSLAQVGEEGRFTRRIARWSRMPASCDTILNRLVNERLLVSSSASGEPILSVAHEALFRVWNTLHCWLLQDRSALSLRAQIEEAATAWSVEPRPEIHAQLLWPEERILDSVSKIARSGVSLEDVADPKLVRAFAGPTDPDILTQLPALSTGQDSERGSGPFGDAWHLPLSHAARSSVGVRLAILDDHRPGVGLRPDGLPDIDWCRIDGGEVTIEIRVNPDDPNSEVADTVTQAVNPFWIARYPVTITQFQTFVVECFRKGDDQTCKWHLPDGVPISLLKNNPPPKHRARYGNHPADMVNWWDAMAFCQWLSIRIGYDVRLPTEYEWQCAAIGANTRRGKPEKIYPWGTDCDQQCEPWRANTTDSELHRSTAVGLYPLGASTAGVFDMAGTVWEWCLNAFEDPDDNSLPGGDQDRRVLRGGSWGNYLAFACPTYRYGRYTDLRRFSFVGFRVMCSTPCLGTKL